MQKLCIRAVCKKGQTTPSECLFEELKVHTFPDLITHELTKFGYKVMNKLYEAFPVVVYAGKAWTQVLTGY